MILDVSWMVIVTVMLSRFFYLCANCFTLFPLGRTKPGKFDKTFHRLPTTIWITIAIPHNLNVNQVTNAYDNFVQHASESWSECMEAFPTILRCNITSQNIKMCPSSFTTKIHKSFIIGDFEPCSCDLETNQATELQVCFPFSKNSNVQKVCRKVQRMEKLLWATWRRSIYGKSPHKY